MAGVLAQVKRVFADFAGAARLAADTRSFFRLATDLALYRVMRLVTLPGQNRERQVRLKSGVTLTYRKNRGDIWALHQMWIAETCRLPMEPKPAIIVDLGANIGLAGLWLAKRYGCTRLLAVEPVASNVAIARRNFAENGVNAEVIEAAIGPEDGTALFEEPTSSANGRLVSGEGAVSQNRTYYEVRLLSMESLLASLPPNTKVDLLKLDVEGAEQALLINRPLWLDRVHAMIAEFHPPTADRGSLTAVLQNAGFQRQAMASHADLTDFFIRGEGLGIRD